MKSSKEVGSISRKRTDVADEIADTADNVTLHAVLGNQLKRRRAKDNVHTAQPRTTSQRKGSGTREDSFVVREDFSDAHAVSALHRQVRSLVRDPNTSNVCRN